MGSSVLLVDIMWVDCLYYCSVVAIGSVHGWGSGHMCGVVRSVRRRGNPLFSALGPFVANYIKIVSKLRRHSFDESKKGGISSIVLKEGL